MNTKANIKSNFKFIIKHLLFSLSAVLLLACSTWKNAPKKYPVKEEKANIQRPKPLEYFATKTLNDPLDVYEYKLPNGLKIFISPNAAEPRIQTLVLVKAGSIHDPADATGLAHYLEHMLFKGNDKIGTINYEAEKVELEKIKVLFETLKSTNDTTKRKNIYHQIDSISGVAAQYACPNEITQLFSQIGAKGTNAYTSKEFTGYINDIPNNQLENWLKIEQQRYSNPVLRLFHTELEAVYEEKNITLDKADRRMSEVFYEAMFPNHNYGQQTTIGTVEHLKSPSMFAIEKFFKKHYVPNNMAVFLSGDIKPDSAYHLVKTYFGDFTPQEVEPYEFNQNHQFTKPVIKTISSKEPQHLMLGYRFPGAGTKESLLVEMIDMLLANSTAGLIDLNVNQQQKAIGAYSYPYVLKDYTMHIMGGQPNDGQSLDDLKSILMEQLNLIKQGKFNDWMLEAVVNDLKKRELNNNRSNRHRVSTLSDAFAKNISWNEQLKYFDKLASITKDEVMDFAQKNYNDKYIAVYRLQNDSTTNLQVEKPAITPIDVPPSNRSEFLLEFSKNNNPKEISPVFVTYNDEIKQQNIDTNSTVFLQKNTQDSLFSLTFVIPYGSDDNKLLSTAFEYAKLCGTSAYSLTELNKKWYQLGIDFGLSVGENESYVSLSGLASNMDEGIKLFKAIVNNLQADTLQLNLLKNKIIQLRSNSLKDKNHLLWSGLKNYLVYGENSAYRSALNNNEVRNLQENQLLELFKKSLNNVSDVFYYGPDETFNTTEFNWNKSDSKTKTYTRLSSSDKNEIFLFDFDLQQAEILMMHKSQQFKKEDLPVITLLNEYFGGGMSSIVFQEIREKKALAYSVYAGYTNVLDSADPHYVLAYIGTQADKYEEAIAAMLDIQQNLPYDSLKFEQAKTAIKQKYASNRIVEHAMLSAFRSDKNLGYSYDKRKDIYEKMDELNFADVKAFFDKNIKGQTYRIAILGNEKLFDLSKLKKFGTVKSVTAEELFPY